MVCFDIKDQTDLWIKTQEAVGIFAGLCYKVLRMTDPDIAADSLQDTADGKGWIELCMEQDLRNHGSGCGFAVGAADGNRELIILHHLTKELCSCEKRKRKRCSCLHFRIIRMDGAGINNKIQVT